MGVAEGSETRIDYPARVQAALLRLVREVLAEAARDGLPGDHHFFLTFRTPDPGVELSDTLRAQHPEQMTIVLQNQFFDLVVDEERLAVTLRFGGKPARVGVPWSALTAFVDPHASFGLSFTPEGAAGPAADAEAPAEAPAAEPVPVPGGPPEGGNVVAFRKPKKR
jgi:hypothetical protein